MDQSDQGSHGPVEAAVAISAVRPLRTAKAKVAGIVMVCSKCRKRQGLRRRAVRDWIEGAMKRSGSRAKLRVVETGCLGPCPKRALAMASGASVAKGRIVLVAPADPEAALVAALVPDLCPNASIAPGPSKGAFARA